MSRSSSPETGATPRGPTIQGAAWRSLLETHEKLIRHIEGEFEDHTPLTLQQYDVLFHIHEVGDGMRMTDLARAVLITKSGLTSLVDRMEAAELIERRPDPTDRRATRIHLTDTGERALAEASRHHRNVVRDIWTSRMSEDEAAVLVDVFARVQAGLPEGRQR